MRAPGRVSRRRPRYRQHRRHIECRHQLIESLTGPVDHPENGRTLRDRGGFRDDNGRSKRAARGPGGPAIVAAAALLLVGTGAWAQAVQNEPPVLFQESVS